MSLQKGSLARAQGLTVRKELNGVVGLIVADNSARLTILTIPDRKFFALKHANLQAHKDSGVTVCARCAEDYWSWCTHTSWEGWSKLAPHRYACARCSAAANAPHGEPPGATTYVTGGGVWAAASAVGGGDWAAASAIGGGAWAAASVSDIGPWGIGNSSPPAFTLAMPATPPVIDGHGAHRVARAVDTLSQSLEIAFANVASRPEWMRTPTDALLRGGGKYDPENGTGITTEMDYGNYAGSILMLAMLEPSLYGVPGAHQLTIFGSGLASLGTAPPRSGMGPDNRRANTVEALLTHLQPYPALRILRDAIMQTWRLLRLASACLRITTAMPQHAANRVISCTDEMLPCGAINDKELSAFELVSSSLSAEARGQLRLLPAGEVAKAVIADRIGFAKGSKVVAALQDALYACGAESIPHGGNLFVLFFSAERTAVSPDAFLRQSAAEKNELALRE